MACLHESQVFAFIAGERDAQVEEHIDECSQCRQLLAELVRKKTTDRDPATDETFAVTPSNPATDRTALASEQHTSPPTGANEWAPGTRVGRYVVLSRIGRGGMGTVFRAEDVELGRPVALKRLHADADSESRARLVREARSAAQLQHPNVVTVHEVGEDAGTPFLAMELVDGVTLTAWLKETTRSWREIVDVVAQAGRGLSAAHERGLVHRDFKPDNVLVDRTGRARVADFGLARASDATPSQPTKHVSVDTRLTATGSLAGTPAYMAPELVEGGAPDTRSDQYAFAVTLYEALRGQHPFEGDTAARLWVEMAAGRVRSGGRSVPAWLDKCVRRGLAVEPAHRWPDVGSFVAAIGKPPRRAWWVGASASAVAIASVVTFVVLREPSKSGPSCDDIANEYRQTFDPNDLARAIPDPTQLALATKTIDRFTTEYRKALRESCRATQAGTQSAAIGDKRTACLELAKRRAWFVTSGITTGIDTRPGLATLLEELPDVAACSDPQWLERASPLPVAQADREALYLAESDLVYAGKKRDDGDLDHASRLLQGVNETARRLNDRSLDARATLLAAEIAHDRGDMDQATRESVEAWSAASMTGDTQLTLRAQLAMLLASASRDRRALESFSGLGTVAESAEGARLITSQADAMMASGHFKEAEAEYRRAQAMREKVLPKGHVELALGMQRIGGAVVIQKRAAEALAILQAAHAIVEKAFPPLRREAIEGLRYLAMAEHELGHDERALELRREVYKRRARVHGPAHGMALEARKDLASSLCDLGHDDDCIHELEETIAGFVELAGDRTANVADARVTLANKLVSGGRFAEADAALAKALPILLQAYGADSPYTMVGEYAQVRSWVERGKPIKLDEATQALDRMEPVFAKLFGAQSHPVGVVLHSRARIALAKHDAKTADELMTRAIAMIGDEQRADRAEGELFHATVLLALGKRDAARAMAEASARDYDAAGKGYAKRAEAARAWAAKPTAAVPMPAQPAAAMPVAAPPATTGGPCDKAGNDIVDVWPAEERDSIASWWRKEPEDGEKLLAMIDRYVADWRAAARAACLANNPQRMLCLDRARERATARIKNAANGTKRSIKDRHSLPDFAHCASTSETLPPDDKAYERIEKGEYYLETARIMFEIKYWNAVYRDLTSVRDQLREYNDASLATRAQQLEAELEAADPRKHPGSGSGD